ncbi:MAG TPA: zinc-binding alcohol dehydrogenase family protein [Sphingomonas sp.]|nr:zinc-binding alcohol dehydrogenase family protein [Sphingomonas sp.]
MKAVICNDPFDLRVVERADPVANAGEVLVRIRRVGVCGTDYHIYGGNQPYLSYPRIMGHELAGEIVQVPAGSALSIGQLVTINPYLSCGTCIACRRGKPNCCVAIRVLGVHVDGGMCDFLAVPESAIVDATGLTLDQAAMVEFLAIGAHAVARARISPGDRTLVVGAGPIGVATALFAQVDGAEVMLIDTRAARLAYARERVGIAHVAQASDTILDAMRAHTAGDMFDRVFDATGNIAAMRSGLDYVAHGGTYTLISVVKDDIVLADPEFHKRETTLLGSRNALAGDFARVIAAIKDGTIPTDALQTHAFAAEDMPERFPALIADADDVLKAIASF